MRAQRFGPIPRALPRVSPATRTATLRALERSGVVHRNPPRTDRRSRGAYLLTGTGQALYRSPLPLASRLRDSV